MCAIGQEFRVTEIREGFQRRKGKREKGRRKREQGGGRTREGSVCGDIPRERSRGWLPPF